MHDDTDRRAKDFTRHRLCKRITYIFAGDRSLGPELGGVHGGYVVLGLAAVASPATAERGEG